MKNLTHWFTGWNANGQTSIVWFIAFSAVLVYAALVLVKNAEVIKSKSKLGAGVVVGILIGGVTASPEFITSIGQSLGGYPGAGSADNIGSNALTALLIGASALLFIRETWLGRLKKWTIISLWIAFAFSLVIAIVQFFGKDLNIGKEGTYAIGLFPLFLLVGYGVLTWLQGKYGDEDEHQVDNGYIQKTSVKMASLKFAFWSVLLLATSVFANVSADSMKETYEMSETSVGGIFLSITMALPESVAFIIFLKHKEYASGVAALVGHTFAIFFSEWLVDVAYANSSAYNTEAVHDVWPLSVITAVSFLFLAIAPLVMKRWKVFTEKKLLYAIFPSLAVLTYVVGWTLMLAL